MNLDREQLKRDCADALEILHRDRRVDGFAELADAIRTLGPEYRAHGELMQVAVRDRNDNTITLALDSRAREAGEGDVETRDPRRA
jgi:hypothetical protein